jgi:hypothetical protein
MPARNLFKASVNAETCFPLFLYQVQHQAQRSLFSNTRKFGNLIYSIFNKLRWILQEQLTVLDLIYVFGIIKS